MLWWFGLSWLVDKVRGKFDQSGILIINRVVGCIVVIFSLIMLLGRCSICISCRIKKPLPTLPIGEGLERLKEA